MFLRLHILLLSLAQSTFAQNADQVKQPHQHETHAQHNHLMMNATHCTDSQAWDPASMMCIGWNNGTPHTQVQFHANGFMVGSHANGNRGDTQLALPHMLMLNASKSFGVIHSLSVNFMATFERWTLPNNGYLEQLQTGEKRGDGSPYVDYQHPHSSPVMGLTVSDTISIDDEGSYLRLFFAPRGQSAEGPVAFMHRNTGMINPDAPLGHHTGQDVGHITSTVIGASLKWTDTALEVSTFSGEEPQPTKVDLPVHKPDSFSFRLIQEFSSYSQAMVSFARVAHHSHSGAPSVLTSRISASFYNQTTELIPGWWFANTFVFGMLAPSETGSSLSSVLQESVFRKNKISLWNRIELLQKAPVDLAISNHTDSLSGQWIAAMTLGTTYELLNFGQETVGAGVAITQNILPNDFKNIYGTHPTTFRAIIQLSSSRDWFF